MTHQFRARAQAMPTHRNSYHGMSKRLEDIFSNITEPFHESVQYISMVDRDIDAFQWDPNFRGLTHPTTLSIRIRAGWLPSPTTFWNEVIVRYPWMAKNPLKEYFYNNCTGCIEEKNLGEHDCAICGNSLYGFPLARHDREKCPFLRHLQQPDESLAFAATNTPTVCNRCGGRSATHCLQPCHRPRPCVCGSPIHQRGMGLCESGRTWNERQVIDAVNDKRVEAYTRIQALARQGQLKYRLPNDSPEAQSISFSTTETRTHNWIDSRPPAFPPLTAFYTDEEQPFYQGLHMSVLGHENAATVMTLSPADRIKFASRELDFRLYAQERARRQELLERGLVRPVINRADVDPAPIVDPTKWPTGTQNESHVRAIYHSLDISPLIPWDLNMSSEAPERMTDYFFIDRATATNISFITPASEIRVSVEIPYAEQIMEAVVLKAKESANLLFPLDAVTFLELGCPPPHNRESLIYRIGTLQKTVCRNPRSRSHLHEFTDVDLCRHYTDLVQRTEWVRDACPWAILQLADTVADYRAMLATDNAVIPVPTIEILHFKETAFAKSLMTVPKYIHQK